MRAQYYAREIFVWISRGLIGWFAAAMIACVPGTPARSTPASSPFVPDAAAATNEARPLRVPTRTPIATTGAITLTLWTTEEFAPGDTPSGKILKTYFDGFATANPKIAVEPVLKKAAGKGGILDFLLTTQAVAPALLPDLVVLDLAEVPLAAEPGILQSFDGWLPPEIGAEHFAVANRAARFQNQWIALPFALDAQHVVYNKNIVKKPPKTWDDFYRQKQQILLPLANDDAFLSQYASIAAFDENAAKVDWATTTLVLNFIKRSRDLGLLYDASLNAKSTEELWSPFEAGQVTLTQIPASRFLAEQWRLPHAGFAALPTRDGKPATVATGWALAVVTKDPARQAAATRFIQWLTQNERIAPWLRAARRLPASRAMLPPIVDDVEYAAFLREQLDQAVYLPRTPANLKLADAWRAAMANVWKAQVTPEDAARAVVATK